MAEFDNFSVDQLLELGAQGILETLHSAGVALVKRCIREPSPPDTDRDLHPLADFGSSSGLLEFVCPEPTTRLLRARFGRLIIPLFDVVGEREGEADGPIAIAGYWNTNDAYNLGQRSRGALVSATNQGGGLSNAAVPPEQTLQYFADENTGALPEDSWASQQIKIISGVILASANIVDRIHSGRAVYDVLIESGRVEPVARVPYRY